MDFPYVPRNDRMYVNVWRIQIVQWPKTIQHHRKFIFMSPTNRNESVFMDRLDAEKMYYVTHCNAR